MTVHQLHKPNRIAQARHRYKPPVSQTWLAEYLGVSRKTLWAWETGRNPIPVAQLERLADFFRVSVDELLGRVSVAVWPGDRS